MRILFSKPSRSTHLTGVERTFGEDEIVVSKTNMRGIITYANDVFLRLASYREEDVYGKPHNIIRHPDMPRCAFKLVWDRIKSGNEVFAYVVNRAKDGDHYWVYAHVTPSFDNSGNIIGYHSNRRCPKRQAVASIIPLYKQLCEVEARASTPKEGMETATSVLLNLLKEKKTSYDEFVFSL